MSSVALQGNASGAGVFTIASPNSASSYTITLPTVTGGSFIVSDSSGNVGIGTSSPTRLLTLSGSGVNTRVQINNTVSSKNFGLYAADDGNSAINYGSSAALLFSESGTERMRIDSSGNVLVTSVAGLGYGTGSGGTVTQATSKSTSVTLNKPTGQITMNNAALAASTNVRFQVNNSLIATTDTIIVNLSSGFSTGSTYQAWVDGIASGSFLITLRNISGGSLSEAIVLNFTVIKGATS